MRLKIADIIFIIVAILFVVIIIRFDDDAPFKSLYWLFVKLAGALIILLWGAISRLKSVKESRLAFILSITVSIISVGYFWGYKSIVRYNRDRRQENFGLILNKNRQKLGVPILPANWKMKYHFSDGMFTWWKGEKDTIGHVSKDVFLDSAGRIESEEDNYHFKPRKGVSRDLSVRAFYSRRKIMAIDSIVYYYDAGIDTVRKFTKQQTDSLLTAENIAKDY